MTGSFFFSGGGGMCGEEDPSVRKILEDTSSQRRMFSVFSLHAKACTSPERLVSLSTRIFLVER